MKKFLSISTLLFFIILSCTKLSYGINPTPSSSLVILNSQNRNINLHLKYDEYGDGTIKSQSPAIITGGIGFFALAYFTQKDQLGTKSQYIKYSGEAVGITLLSFGTAAYIFNF